MAGPVYDSTPRRPAILHRTLTHARAPFVAAILFGFALIPVQDAPIEPARLAIAMSAISSLVLLAVTIGRVPWFPNEAGRLLPYLYLLAVALLREATGGTVSGYGALLFLAPFWVALYDTRRQVLLVVLAVFGIRLPSANGATG